MDLLLAAVVALVLYGGFAYGLYRVWEHAGGW